MKIVIVQMEPLLGKVEVNREKIKTFTEKAGVMDPDLIVFPELCTSGYNLSQKLLERTSESIPGKTTEMLKTQAKQFDTTIIAGINEQSNNCYYNTAAILTPNDQLYTYRKVHLFHREKALFKPGATFNVIKTEKANIGVLICFDWFFPESTRILALKGADIIAHPSNLVPPHPTQGIAIRALENKVFTATANRIGKEGKLTFLGHSKVITPTGETLVKASKGKEEMITVEIDSKKARDKTITTRNRLFSDINDVTLTDLAKLYQQWDDPNT